MRRQKCGDAQPLNTEHIANFHLSMKVLDITNAQICIPMQQKIYIVRQALVKMVLQPKLQSAFQILVLKVIA